MVDSSGSPCSWCATDGFTTGAFACTKQSLCSASNTQQTCDVGSVAYIPASCPDNCSNAGQCVNGSVCVCNAGITGLNCGSATGLSTAATAAIISAGVIAAIVICGVVVVVILIFAAKKTVDFVMLNQQAAAHFANNPLHINRGTDVANQAYDGSS